MTNKEKLSILITINKGEKLTSNEKNHAQMLDNVFSELSRELDINGNTKNFNKMRIKFADELIDYWKQKNKLYSQAKEENKLVNGKLIINDEKLEIIQSGIYDNDNEKVLQIKRVTPTEEDEVTITAGVNGKVDQFPYPPTIKSKIKNDADNDLPDLYYEVIFRRNGISKIKKTTIRTNTENNSYMKDTREIDCSTFGIEI